MFLFSLFFHQLQTCVMWYFRLLTTLQFNRSCGNAECFIVLLENRLEEFQAINEIQFGCSVLCV